MEGYRIELEHTWNGLWLAWIHKGEEVIGLELSYGSKDEAVAKAKTCIAKDVSARQLSQQASLL